jgi:hypothetical protein
MLEFDSLEIRMQLKIFGSSVTPDEEFTKALKTLFEIEEEAWDDLAKWFLTTESFDDIDDSSAPAVAASIRATLPEIQPQPRPIFCVGTLPESVLFVSEVQSLQIRHLAVRQGTGGRISLFRPVR